MRIINAEFGTFSEVEHLNNRFIKNRTKQKLTIDAISPRNKFQVAYQILIRELRRFFPTIEKHDCSLDDASYLMHKGKTKSGPLHNFHDIIDVLHVIEHIMIELQCSVSLMPICSGITCQYFEPRTRYDIFVEAVQKNVAAFSGYFAVNLVKSIIKHGKLQPKFQNMLVLAKFFSKNPSLASSIKKIPKSAGFSLDVFGPAVSDLIRFQYF
ncbi:hypothetical protein JXJ21_18345 [candidate division KSB1 bacterium]|nr:hypothetical protein [candidate division KSB1 bacterium]